MDESKVLSPPIVIDTCLKSCKAMKLMSKQLVAFSGVYSKTPNCKGDEKIFDIFVKLINHINGIQDLLTELAKTCESSLGNETYMSFPDNVIISHNEYHILYRTFMEFTDKMV